MKIIFNSTPWYFGLEVEILCERPTVLFNKSSKFLGGKEEKVYFLDS